MSIFEEIKQVFIKAFLENKTTKEFIDEVIQIFIENE